VPNSSTIGISKRLPDGNVAPPQIIDDVKPSVTHHHPHAAEGVTADDLARDVTSLSEKWAAIEAEVAKSSQRASCTATSTSPFACCAKNST